VSVPEFVALADLLRPLLAVASPAEAPIAAEPAVCVRSPQEEATPDAVRAAIADARRFRARLADAFDAALAALVRELACTVLARELALAPCDVRALARRVLDDAPVVRLRVAPDDGAAEYGIVTVVDPALRAGDAVFELQGGALDARLGVRLADALERVL
jgi:flagellar biosynthesis/type III secretory pathway protein FliH